LLFFAALVGFNCGAVNPEATEETDTVSQANHALVAPWRETDIGAVGVAGDSTNSGGAITINGSGSDIWGTADAFHYMYQRLNGNTQIVAKVTGITNTNAWAKAGVMVRDTLAAGSRHASLFLTPSNGVSFQSRDTTGGISVSATVAGITAPSWVKLARSGDQFSAYRSPDGVTWTQVGTTRTIDMPPVIYVGLAATSHDNTRVGSASFSNVQLISPPVLLVVGNTTLNSGDAAAKKRLEALGYAVTVKLAASSTSADANGKDLVVISSTVTSTDVGSKFTNVAVPVLTWENAILDDLGMTLGAAGTDFGTTANQTNASIFTTACNRATMYTSAVGFGDGCHDISAGLSGTFALLRQSGPVSWGKPGSAAQSIAFEPGNTNHALVFGYDKGAAMPLLASAPARRVFVFLGDTTASTWTAKGQSLFDNAVFWATRTRYSITKKVLHLNYNPTLPGQGNALLSTFAGNRWFWNPDPIQLMRDELADITEASGGYVRWKLVKYGNIPDTLNQWVPITGPEQFHSATFTDQKYIDAYDYAFNTRDFAGAGLRMPNGGNYVTDVNRILDDFAVDAKVNAGEVDELVVSTFAYAGQAESTTAGSTAFPINGPSFFRNTPNFVIMGQSYERQLSEALENFGHRSEWYMAFHVFRSSSGETLPYNPCYWPVNSACGTRQPTPQRDIWDRFSVVDGNLAGQAGVGAAHWAPNAQTRTDEYRWDLTNFANSMGDDWYFNYPKLVGSSTARLVNVEEWRPMAQDGEPGRAFKKWWYHHMPRVPGHYVDAGNAGNDGKLNNWWEYIVNPNRHPETQN
jgi:hypothetical protein